jgi:hypothetical protein
VADGPIYRRLCASVATLDAQCNCWSISAT